MVIALGKSVRLVPQSLQQVQGRGIFGQAYHLAPGQVYLLQPLGQPGHHYIITLFINQLQGRIQLGQAPVHQQEIGVRLALFLLVQTLLLLLPVKSRSSSLKQNCVHVLVNLNRRF